MDCRGWLFAGSGEVDGVASLGTSKLCLVPAVEMRLCLMWSAVAVGDTWTGNLVSGPPELRSLRWPRGEGAGLVARLREPLAMMARARASMLALRFDSSVLIARGRVSTLTLWEREEARLSSVNMASL
jgi:hypothetical protein